jgi:ABC-type transport system involved in multi-copper enzyme maturation permease subunit
MNAVTRALWNPIVAKEYRSRMRTWRSPLAMTVYIVLLGGIGWAVYSAITSGALGLGSSGNYGQMGQQLFTFLILFQVALLAFITPALTAGAISGERERQTIDLLFVTPIPPFSIIWGKLLASMSFMVLLLALSVPIFSLVFLIGGIELDQMVYAFLVVGVTALTLGFIGIAFSTFFRRTLVATVAAYGAAFVLLIGTLVYGLLLPVDVNPQATMLPAPPAVTMLSPVLPLLTIATNAPITGYGVRYQNGPYTSGGNGYCTSLPNGGTSCYSTSSGPVGPVNGSLSQPSGTTIPTGLFTGWQYWQATVVMQLVICLAALVFSALVLPPVHRFRLRRKSAPAPSGE